MKSWKKTQKLRIKLYFMKDSVERTNYLVKNNVFQSVGDNFFFQPRVIPADPKLIIFHNNVHVASGVTFVNHDITHNMLNNLGIGNFSYVEGCIEVMDNVFIGANSTILPNVRIGSNVIIGAGSVVTHDVPDNSVVAGVPAKVIKTFDEYLESRKKMVNSSTEDLWRTFYEERGNNK